jgi:hypothetical protein
MAENMPDYLAAMKNIKFREAGCSKRWIPGCKNKYDEIVTFHGAVCSRCSQRIHESFHITDNGNVCLHCEAA